MTYRASDIVKRAKQLADLENSDFISWNENISMLNEAYAQVYQKVINHNNRDFLAEPITIGRGINTLPEDFYQLNTVMTRWNDIIPKVTPGMSRSALGYKLGNGKIELQGIDEAIVTYYPVPKFLTYPSETIVLEGVTVSTTPNVEQIVMANGHYLLTTQKVIDLETGETRSVPSPGSGETRDRMGIDASGNVRYQLAAKTPDGRTIWAINRQVNGFDVFEFSDDITGLTWRIAQSIVMYNSRTQYTIIEDKLYQTFSASGEIYEYSPALPNATYSKQNNLGYKRAVAPTASNGHILTGVDRIISIDGIPIWDGTQICSDTMVVGKYMVYPCKIDFNTGYGFVSMDPTTNQSYAQLIIRSIAPDTELDFPNNLFFSILAYQLAYAYCCKQSKDTTYIEKQLAVAFDTFYDTINNDNWQQQTFINNYRYRG